MHLVPRYLRAETLPAEASWVLVEWCRAHGATELTLTAIEFVDSPNRRTTEMEAALAPFRLPGEARLETGESGARWALTEDVVRVLRARMGDGLMTYEIDVDGGSVEDPILFRAGEPMLRIVTHEGEGVLRLTPAEHAEVAALGIVTHDVPVWI